MPKKEVYLSLSSDGSSDSGSVHSSVRLTIAPLRLASILGSPAAAKTEENESPMIIVYCSEADAHSSATNDEGTHDELAPTVLLQASPHEVDSVSSHTRATIEKR